MKDRLKKVRTEWAPSDGGKPTQEKFAEYLNISKAAVVAYETGSRKPQSAAIQLICSKFGVNQKWLETGEGEMYLPELDEDARIAALLSEKSDAFTDTIKSIAKSYFDMTEEEQKVVQKLFEAIKK